MRNGDLSAFARFVGLRAFDEDRHALLRPADVFDIETDKLRPAESACKTKKDERAIPNARQALIAHRTNPADVPGRQGSRTPGPSAMPAANASQGFPNGRMPSIERMSGHAKGAGDCCHAAAQCGWRIAFTGGSQIGADDSGIGLCRRKSLRFAPGLEMSDIRRVGLQRARRIGSVLISLGFSESNSCSGRLGLHALRL